MFIHKLMSAIYFYWNARLAEIFMGIGLHFHEVAMFNKAVAGISEHMIPVNSSTIHFLVYLKDGKVCTKSAWLIEADKDEFTASREEEGKQVVLLCSVKDFVDEATDDIREYLKGVEDEDKGSLE